MEDFIERSNALLTVRPQTAKISTRYTHKRVAGGGERVDASAKPAKFVIKVHDPPSGLIYKYKAKKANEFSRILASLGPQFFEFESERKRGAASIMSDVEPEEPAAVQHEAAPAKEAPKEAEEVKPTSSKSKKKKKSKK